MFHILFATDGSDAAAAAVRFVAALPLPEGTSIRVVSVVEAFISDPATGWPAGGAMLESERQWARDANRRAMEALTRAGVSVSEEIRDGEASHQILEAAEEFSADLLVLGATGVRGLEELLLGSVARAVARHAPCPVLVARAPRFALRQAILALDGSEHAAHAAAFAARLPLPAETRFLLVHVLRRRHPHPAWGSGDPDAWDRTVIEADRKRREQASALLESARAGLTAAGRPCEQLVAEGEPAEEVARLAGEREADLVIAGARGVSLIRGLLMGSVADRLLERAPGSVLLVR
jgi:nucleotide-binding universal stress UspA family protein